MKQTAVEWLIIQMHTHWTNEDVTFQTLLEQAKAMEKEQISDAYQDGWMSCEKWFEDERLEKETYKQD